MTILGTDLSKRIYGLDILRTIAVSLILLVHTYEFLPFQIRYILNFVMYDGVTIFFVLSGFLIGTILIKTIESNRFTTKRLLNFWGNRWLRTLPLYYCILFIWVLIAGENLGILQILKYIFFIQNFNGVQPEFFIVSWSLSIEEWFYLLVPILLFICTTIFKIDNKRSVLFIVIFVILSVNAIRLYRYCNLVYNIGLDPNWSLFSNWFFRTQVITRLDGVIYGVLGAYLAYYYKSLWLKNKLMKLLIGLFLLYIFPRIVNILVANSFVPIYNNVFDFTIAGLGVMLLLPFLESIKKGQGNVYRFVTLISLVSYSIYLTHSIVNKYIKIIGEYLDLNHFLQFCLVWILSILISCLTYRFIEKPIMDMRKTILKKG